MRASAELTGSPPWPTPWRPFSDGRKDGVTSCGSNRNHDAGVLSSINGAVKIDAKNKSSAYPMALTSRDVLAIRTVSSFSFETALVHTTILGR